MDHELLVVANGLETGLGLCVAGEFMWLDQISFTFKLTTFGTCLDFSECMHMKLGGL